MNRNTMKQALEIQMKLDGGRLRLLSALAETLNALMNHMQTDEQTTDIDVVAINEMTKAISDIRSKMEQLTNRDSDRAEKIELLSLKLQKLETLIKTLPESNSTPQEDTGSPMIGSIKLQRMEEDLVKVIERAQRLDIRLTNLEGRIAPDDLK